MHQSPYRRWPTGTTSARPPSPGYGDFGLLGKGLFPEPPPSGGLLDWVGFGDFLTRNRGGQEPRFAREAPRPVWQTPDGGLLGMFDGSDDRKNTARDATTMGAPVATATATAGRGRRPGGTAYPRAQTTFDVGPPTSEAVDFQMMMKALGFDPDGRGLFGAAIEQTLQDPFYAGRGEIGVKAWRADTLSDDARNATGKQFPNVRPHNNEADAFRHGLWNFQMTRDLGTEAAKRLSDGYEITRPGPAGELLMDLYNNNVGRQLALDPGNRDRPPEEVILEALRAGRLQTRPYNTGQGEKTDGRLLGTSLGNSPNAAYVADTPGRYVRRYGGPR